MSPKKLPKAITRTSEDMRKIAAGTTASEHHKKPVPHRVAKDLADDEAAAPKPAPRPAPKPAPQPVRQRVEEKKAPPPHETVEPKPVPAIARPPVEGELLPPISASKELPVSPQRLQAQKIVKWHTTYAAAGSLIPMPVVNVAGVTAIILRMVKKLSDLYGVPFEQDRARALVMGLMGGAVPTGLAVATASALTLVIPGSGIIGLAVSSLTAAGLTRGIGFVFIEHFESGAAPIEVVMSEPA